MKKVTTLGISAVLIFIVGFLAGMEFKTFQVRSTIRKLDKSISDSIKETTPFYKSFETTGTQVQTTPKELGKVEVKSHKRTSNGYGGAQIVGEVINKTQNYVQNIKVIATLYDDKGEVVGSEDAHAGNTWDTPLEINKTAPFDINPDKNIVFDTYKLDVFWD